MPYLDAFGDSSRARSTDGSFNSWTASGVRVARSSAPNRTCVRARPTGVGRALTACRMPIEGSDRVDRRGKSAGMKDRPAGCATYREVVVVAAVLVAGSEKAAAHRLGLSHSTVKHHLANARSKLGRRQRRSSCGSSPRACPNPRASPTSRSSTDALSDHGGCHHKRDQGQCAEDPGSALRMRVFLEDPRP